MTNEDLLHLIGACEDVEDADVRELLDSSDPQTRLLARTAVAKTCIRRALEQCGNLAREQGYTDQNTLNVIQRLSAISDINEPYIETLKQLGLQAARARQCNAAMQYLQEAVNIGFASGQRADARSRRAIRYSHDLEMDRALEHLAPLFTPPAFAEPQDPLRLVLLCSTLMDEDGPSVITLKRAEHFTALGFDVRVVSTAMAPSSASRMVARLRAQGLEYVESPTGAWDQRLQWLIAYFGEHPADAISYMTSANDMLAKLAACVRLSPVQSWDNRALEPQAGQFDLINQTLSREQETKTHWPGISRWTGGCVAMADEIDAAQPFSRVELGLPEKAVLLATFGRLEKCATIPYMDALARTLKGDERAWLVLAGRDAFGALERLRGHFRAQDVMERVLYLGARQHDGPRLLKTVDVYCDTHPWPGGQSLVDAMQAGLPIVAMRRAEDPDLDPLGASATTSVADVLLDGVLELAGAGDAEAYARIALDYIGNPQLRSEAGRRARDKVLTDCNTRTSTQRYGALLRELVATREPARTI